MSARHRLQQAHHVRKVQSHLYNTRATLKLKKRSFFINAIDYLGHVTRLGRLELPLRTTDAIRGFKPETSLAKLGSVLGLCNVFKGFLSNFVQVASPLSHLLQNFQPNTFALPHSEEHPAMHTLTCALISPPWLAHPHSSEHMTLDTATCNVQIGSVLLQKQPGYTTNSVIH